MTHHESFGKVFATLQLGTLFAGADHRDSSQCRILFEEVIDTFHQRIFRTHNDHIDLVGQDKGFDRLEIIGFDVDVGPCQSCTGISRCDEQLIHFRTLGDFPGNGMFATT